MSDQFMGEIVMFGGNFAPRNWAFCSGQLVAISQNTALFSLLGTVYGGNGQSNFGLPDLRGRTPVGVGQGLGLQFVELGEQGGVEQVTLLVSNIPSHTHLAATTVTPGTSSLTASTTINVATGVPPAQRNSTPTGNILTVPVVAGGGGQVDAYCAAGQGTAGQMAAGAATTTVSGSMTATAATTVQPTGSSLPFENASPYLGINFLIATQGIYPTRN